MEILKGNESPRVTIKKLEPGVGVVVARFQTPHLHEAHRYLLKCATSQDRTIIVLGVPIKGPDENNPLDFETRRLMVQDWLTTEGEDAAIVPLMDCPGEDRIWTERLMNLISITSSGGKIYLYGGRDSFLDHLDNSVLTSNVQMITVQEQKSILGDKCSATALRKKVAFKPEPTEDFRCGVIYALRSMQPWIKEK